MTQLPFKQVDVFTARPFFGNPVAVVIGADSLETAQMNIWARIFTAGRPASTQGCASTKTEGDRPR